MSQTDLKEKLKKAWDTVKTFVVKAARAIAKYAKAAKIELIVLAGALALDLITKGIIQSTMSLGQSVTLIPNFLSFTYILNKGAAFGSMFGLDGLVGETGVRVIFIIFTLIAMGLFSFMLYRSKGKHIVLRLSLALIIAGALGNWLDRVFLGSVRDLVHITYFGLDLPLLGTDFAIFNIADAALTIGVVMFAVFFIFIYREPKKPIAQKADDAIIADAEVIEDDSEANDTAASTDIAESMDSEPATGAEDFYESPEDEDSGNG